MNKALTIIEFELKRNLKLIVIWSVAVSLFAVLTIAMFPYLKDQAASLQQALSGFPPEILDALGSSSDSLTRLNEYFNSKFLFMFVIINAIFGAYLISSITGKEINDTSIAQIFLKKVSRTTILLSKYSSFVILLFASNFVSLVLSYLTALVFIKDEVSLKFFVVGYIAAFFVQLVFATVGMFISIVWSESLALFSAIGLSLGLFIFDAISRFKGMPEFVKYLTPYYYQDLKGTAMNETLKPENILILVVMIIMFVVASVIAFRKKDVDV